MFWDGPTGPVDASQFDDGPEQEEPPDAGSSTPSESGSTQEDLDDALRRVVLDDIAGTRDALGRAGFSESEANRLIFERQRPREEGRRRN